MVNKMRRSTWSYSCMLIALALSLIAISCGGSPSTGSTGGTPGSVFISPKTQNAKAGSQIKVSVEVAPGDWGVSGAEIRLSFDPQKLEAISVKPGAALGANPIQGLSKIDNSAGTIVLAIARQGETTSPGAKGALANIEFRAKTGASGTARIELKGTALSDEIFQPIAGLILDGADIIFR